MRNYEVQRLFETLVEVWSEALARGEKIEIANFVILELHTITRHGRLGTLISAIGKSRLLPSGATFESG